MVHSAYYMSALDWGRLSEGDTVYVVAHRFLGTSGNFHGEFTWRREGGEVVMEPCHGSGTTYRHRDITRDMDNGFRFHKPDGTILAASGGGIVNFGATTCFQFVITARKTKQPWMSKIFVDPSESGTKETIKGCSFRDWAKEAAEHAKTFGVGAGGFFGACLRALARVVMLFLASLILCAASVARLKRCVAGVAVEFLRMAVAMLRLMRIMKREEVDPGPDAFEECQDEELKRLVEVGLTSVDPSSSVNEQKKALKRVESSVYRAASRLTCKPDMTEVDAIVRAAYLRHKFRMRSLDEFVDEANVDEELPVPIIEKQMGRPVYEPAFESRFEEEVVRTPGPWFTPGYVMAFGFVLVCGLVGACLYDDLRESEFDKVYGRETGFYKEPVYARTTDYPNGRNPWSGRKREENYGGGGGWIKNTLRRHEEKRRSRVEPIKMPVDISGHIHMESLVLPTLPGAYKPDVVVGDTVCLGFGNESNLGRHCRIDERPKGQCLGDHQAGATLVGWTTSPAFVCRKCGCNAHNAMCMRHGVKQPQITRTFSRASLAFREAFSQVGLEYVLLGAGDREEWLDKWPVSKRKSFIESEWFDEPVTKCVKQMVKRELNHSRPSKARAIQYYFNPITQAQFGPQFYALQKAVCRVFNRYQLDKDVDVTIASGLSGADLGAWMDGVLERGASHFYERDGKSWDATMQKAHADFRTGLYDIVDPSLGKFARDCLNVTGYGMYAEGRFKYHVDGTVKSGHNDTTLGNGLVNAAIAFESMKTLGLAGSILVSGDDLLVAVYGDFDENSLAGVERELGILPEYRKFDSFSDVSFISGVWFKNGERCSFIPKPGRIIARQWWTVKPPGKKKRVAYLNGSARSVYPALGGLPILGDWLRPFMVGDEEVGHEKNVVHRGGIVWHPQALEYMSCRYGVSVGDILDCVSYLRSLPSEPLFVKHPVLDALMAVDLADLMDRPISGC
jgi:hypothetical protein